MISESDIDRLILLSNESIEKAALAISNQRREFVETFLRNFRNDLFTDIKDRFSDLDDKIIKRFVGTLITNIKTRAKEIESSEWGCA